MSGIQVILLGAGVFAVVAGVAAFILWRTSPKEGHAELHSHYDIRGPLAEMSVKRENGKVVLHYFCRGTYEPTGQIVTVDPTCRMEPEIALAMANDLFENARLAIIERDGAE